MAVIIKFEGDLFTLQTPLVQSVQRSWRWTGPDTPISRERAQFLTDETIRLEEDLGAETPVPSNAIALRARDNLDAEIVEMEPTPNIPTNPNIGIP